MCFSPPCCACNVPHLALALDSLAITKGVLGPSTKHCAYQIPMLPVGSPYRGLAIEKVGESEDLLDTGRRSAIVAKISGQRVT